jgi:hypothetical protein
MEPKFLVTINENPPVIMCEKHAKVFETMMVVNEIPHTIYEMEDEDVDQKCQACNLLPDIIDNQPRIVLLH